MSPVGLQPRRSLARPAGRRRTGGGWFAGEPSPQLFPAGCDEPVAADAPAEVPEAVEPRARVAGSAGDEGHRMTLGQLICGVWDEVLVEGRAACPVCGGELEGRASAHARPTEGACRECGTTIA